MSWGPVDLASDIQVGLMGLGYEQGIYVGHIYDTYTKRAQCLCQRRALPRRPCSGPWQPSTASYEVRIMGGNFMYLKEITAHDPYLLDYGSIGIRPCHLLCPSALNLCAWVYH